jgi:hypothetical protein
MTWPFSRRREGIAQSPGPPVGLTFDGFCWRDFEGIEGERERVRRLELAAEHEAAQRARAAEQWRAHLPPDHPAAQR